MAVDSIARKGSKPIVDSNSRNTFQAKNSSRGVSYNEPPTTGRTNYTDASNGRDELEKKGSWTQMENWK